ncbi:MAG: amino acid racemase [Pseudomonadota bacterium]
MNKHTQTVGVIGGMGPAATLEFAQTVMAMTGAVSDEQHIPMLIDNDTHIPNRQAAILGDGPSPGPAIAQSGQRLQAAGADFLVMPCNTAHAFIEELLAAVSVPFVSILDVSVDACRDYPTVGVLSTRGCLEFGGYQQALTAEGVQVVTPEDDEVHLLSELVVQIKSGDIDREVRDAMTAHFNALHDRGCDVVLSACTEIPLVLDATALPCPLICSTRELAKATVSRAKQARRIS